MLHRRACLVLLHIMLLTMHIESCAIVQLHRLLTCFLYAGKFSWSAFIGLHLMTQISTRYETMGPICTRRLYINPQLAEQEDAQNNNATQQQREERHPNNNNSPYYSRGETSDYIFALLFGMTGILLSQILLFPILPTFITQNQHHRFFQRHLTFYIVYIWSKQHPQRRVNLFGMPIAAAYLPFAYLVMGYALNNGNAIPIDILHGMLVGHVYFYLACIVPTVLGERRAVISTPMILIDLCNWLEGRGFVDNDDNGGNGGPILVDVDGVIGG